MRAITLWQPWASLIFAGRKQHETRPRRYPRALHLQTIVIHAAARPVAGGREMFDQLHEICMEEFGCSYNHTLPRGAALGTVRLMECWETDVAKPASEDDRWAGNWEPNRWAWLLGDVIEFGSPVPAIGKQGWWEFTGPEIKAAPIVRRTISA